MEQNSGAPRSQEDYITQVSEEIEGRVTKRLSKEFSRTENRILGALARLDDFLMNPLLPGHSGTAPEPTRNTTRNNQGTNEDGSQTDPHPEASLFHGQREQNSGTENDYDSRHASKGTVFVKRFLPLLFYVRRSNIQKKNTSNSIDKPTSETKKIRIIFILKNDIKQCINEI